MGIVFIVIAGLVGAPIATEIWHIVVSGIEPDKNFAVVIAIRLAIISACLFISATSNKSKSLYG